MPNDNPSLTNLQNEVAETTTVQQSAVVLLQGLKSRLDAAIAELAQAGVTNEALNQLSSDLNNSTDSLAAAVAANTPGEEPSGVTEEETEG
jgi:hypothetical protein